uniref:Putative g2/m phase-specific e3 ubiquitin-protein ligase n=1 Tax=Ixodes ricinus TaxID=34613 RepID=A0A131YB61_IXORI
MCKKAFHVGCGNANECLLQFHGDYRAYCPDHRPRQRIRPKESGSTSCLICTCDMVSEPSPQVLVTPCCQHSFHRACLQAQASSAGSYFFKCCICNNIDAFQKEMLDHGICIPQQDASWEREQGAYQDLLYRYQRCDAERCRCPNGRETSLEESGDWEVITCSTCGSQGIHKACGNLSKEPLQRTNSWVCVQCRKTLSLRPGTAAVIPPISPLKRKGAAESTSSEPPITKVKETELPFPKKTEVLPVAATPCSGILPASGSPCPEIPPPSGSPGPKVSPPSSSPCPKILPMSGSLRPEILPPGNSLSPSREAAGATASSPQSKKDDNDDDSDIEVIAVVLRPKQSPLHVIILDDSDDSDLEDLCNCPRCYNL